MVGNAYSFLWHMWVQKNRPVPRSKRVLLSHLHLAVETSNYCNNTSSSKLDAQCYSKGPLLVAK